MTSPAPGQRPFPARALKATVTILLGALAAHASAAPGPAVSELPPWKNPESNFYIGGPIRLNLGFVDQKGTPRVAEIPSLQSDQIAGLPNGVAQAKDSPLLRTGYFDSLWTAMKAGVCNDVHNQILKLVSANPNGAYDVQPCIMNPRGYLSANFQESWTDSSLETVNGRRFKFNYQVPLNGVVFWVASPHTCHHGNTCPTEPQDPAYSFVFNVVITVTCTSAQPNATSFTLPVSCTPAANIVGEALLGGDVTGALTAAVAQWTTQTIGEAASVGATGGASLPEAAAAFIAKGIDVAVVGLGTAIAGITDEHLRDQVSSDLMGFVVSQTLNANVTNVNHDFNSLFTNLYNAYLGGLRPFAVAIGLPDLDFDFGLVYHLPARPQIENRTAANNVSLFSPTIAVSQPEVVAGQLLPVTATFFKGTYVNSLDITWNKTVLGPTTSHLTWGLPQQTSTVTMAELTYVATNLKPGTGYQFSVQECDAITCAPTSELLKTSTEAAGANDVTFWLDSNVNQKLGSNVVGSNGGSFQTNVLIPASTTTGTHLLYAGVLGRPPASATIQVCQAGVCGPTVAVVNTSNNTLYPPGSVVEVGMPVVLRGSKFAPGGSAWIWMDSIQGTKAGAGQIGPLGNFQANFTMPMVAPGQHKLLAVELKPGVKLPPTPKGQKPAFPPQDFVTAAVAIYVQAMAQ